ncbi:MAG TPA: hypothetical protein VIX42_03770 [Edaphobacter sp.]
MSTTPAKPPEFEVAHPQHTTADTRDAQGVIAWSSFFFALLQSICTFFAALDGLRLVIGISSLAVATWASSVLDKLHADWIRIPMVGLALVGSLLNLAILMQIRRLRSRPASQWRQKEVSPGKIRTERMQMVLSITTLVLIGVEEYLHFRMCHHL